MFKIIDHIAPSLDVLAPLVALFFAVFRKQFPLKEHIFIVLYIMLQLVLNNQAKYLHYQKVNNLVFYKINCISSLILVSIYFLIKFRASCSKPVFNTILGIDIMAVITTLFLFVDEGPEEFNSRSYSFTALMICTQVVFYYYLKLRNPALEKITSSRSFWFITGLFAYYAGAFGIFSVYKSFLHKPKISVLWSMHNIFLALMCICFSIGFSWKKYQKT